MGHRSRPFVLASVCAAVLAACGGSPNGPAAVTQSQPFTAPPVAPPPPEPKVEGAVSTDTTLTWPVVPSASSYQVRWRRTDANERGLDLAR